MLKKGVNPWNRWRRKNPNIRPDLGGALLGGANLTELIDRGRAGIDPRGGGYDIKGIDLREANLREADLSGARLRRANLRNANLTGASLSKADLSEADIGAAYLRGAYLRGRNSLERNAPGRLSLAKQTS